MTSVLIERSKDGSFFSCKAEGHAGYAGKGYDIVCSAITVLIRTTLQVLEKIPDIELNSDFSQRGKLSFVAKIITNDSDSIACKKLSFAEDFLEVGLSSIESEYPDFLQLKIVYRESLKT